MKGNPPISADDAYQTLLDGMVSAYRNVPVFDVTFAAPYWMNKITGDIQTCVAGPYNGKATPFQIAMEVELGLEQYRYDPDLRGLARSYCVTHHIGIDCSGFMFFVLSEFLQYAQRNNFPHKKQLYPEELLRGIDGTGRLRRINADILTSIENGYEVPRDETRFGDLVRIREGSHVAMVRSTNENGVVIAHSTSEGHDNGVMLSPMSRNTENISFWRMRVLEEYCF